MNNSSGSSIENWLQQQLTALALPLTFQEQPLTAEASHRRFSRLRFPASDLPGCPSSVVLMQSPPALERNQAFVELSLAMRAADIPVPEVLAGHMGQGWLLLSDVGERDFFTAYQSADKTAALTSAIALLPRLQRLRSPALTDYSADLVSFELEIFSEWLIQGLAQLPKPPSSLDAIWSRLQQNFAEQPKVCVHLDYHCRNLLYSPQGQLGVVDFQDARLGPWTYDLASLLRDCYFQMPEKEVQRWVNEFVQALNKAGSNPGGETAEALIQQMDLTALQRQLKAVGIFARLWLRDGKRSHLRHIQPTMAQTLELAGRYPSMHPLQDYLHQVQPKIDNALQALPAGTPAHG